MPITFNEPLSFLQRVAEYMEYSELLQEASDSQDPVERHEVSLLHRIHQNFVIYLQWGIEALHCLHWNEE